jgi:hypothetical protein
MSTPTPNDLTRQQLDELDTLLQRMLNLPLNGTGDADAGSLPPPPEPPPVAVPSGPWRVDAPEVLAKTPYLAPESAPLVVPLTAAPASLPEVAKLFGPPTSVERYSAPVPVPGTLRGVDAPALPPGFRSAFAEEPVALDPAARLGEVEAVPPAARRSVPVHHWPLFGVNWVLEGVLSLGGPFGKAATHPAVKHLLGGVGVLLLAAAGVWAARGMGWIDLPLPLPR